MQGKKVLATCKGFVKSWLNPDSHELEEKQPEARRLRRALPGPHQEMETVTFPLALVERSLLEAGSSQVCALTVGGTSGSVFVSLHIRPFQAGLGFVVGGRGLSWVLRIWSSFPGLYPTGFSSIFSELSHHSASRHYQTSPWVKSSLTEDCCPGLKASEKPQKNHTVFRYRPHARTKLKALSRNATQSNTCPGAQWPWLGYGLMSFLKVHHKEAIQMSIDRWTDKENVIHTMEYY